MTELEMSIVGEKAAPSDIDKQQKRVWFLAPKKGASAGISVSEIDSGNGKGCLWQEVKVGYRDASGR